MSSDEMTVWYHPPPGHVVMEADFPARHWVLQLIADFSVLQSYIEVGVERKLNLGAPAAAKVVFKKFLRRLTDEDRWSLVKALAVDCDYDGDLSSGSDTFWQSKRVRDLFAHRSDVPLVREAGSPEFFYFMMGTVPRGCLSPLTPAAVRQLGANCRWLHALVEHLVWRSGVPCASVVVKRRADGVAYLPSLEMLAPRPIGNRSTQPRHRRQRHPVAAGQRVRSGNTVKLASTADRPRQRRACGGRNVAGGPEGREIAASQRLRHTPARRSHRVNRPSPATRKPLPAVRTRWGDGALAGQRQE